MIVSILVVWRRGRVVSYYVGRVIDIDNGQWGLNCNGPSSTGYAVTVMFEDLTSVNIKARKGKVYSIGDHLRLKKVVLFRRYTYYVEIS